MRNYYGQELTSTTYNLARMNMILRGIPYRNFNIYNCLLYTSSNSIRRGCKKIVEENNIDISFDDEIFDGIIPKENTDTVLSSDATATHYWLYACLLYTSRCV